MPDETFQAAEEVARKLGLSRSELYVRPVKHYLQTLDDEAFTEPLNHVYDGMDSELNPALNAAARRTLERNEW